VAFTLLHVSDVHFGPHCQVAIGNPSVAGRQLADQLVRDLRSRLSKPVDAIVASGDFTWTNDQPEFESALSFLRQLATLLGLSVKEIVVVPGNHDVTWSQADAAVSEGFKILVAEEAALRYREFVQQLLGVRLGELMTTARVFTESRVAILALDSCRLPNKQDAGLGYVGRDQVEYGIAMLRAVPAYQADEESFFKIAVLHHHLLPALDIDLSVLREPPARRRFSLTLDAASVVRLLLADNFALALHGHLHIPFGAVERRVWGPAGALDTHPTAALGVSAAGSLSVKEPHAQRNEYQVITIGDERIHFRIVSGLFGPDPEERGFELSRAEITFPAAHLELPRASKRGAERNRARLLESDILAERLARREPGLTDWLFELVAMRAGQVSSLSRVGRIELRELFDVVIKDWLEQADPKSRYDRIAASQGLTIPEYVLHLMVALRDLS
jgi:predicted phosphohydrolase